MKTPEQIRDMEFQKSPMGGYKQSDVELFLEEMASEIEILMRQKADAERKLQEFSQKSPDGALSTAGIQNVLVSAQRVAEQITDEANNKAAEIVRDANLKLTEADIRAKEIIADAESKARLLGDTAEKEAAKIIAGAVTQSEEIIASAKESVELEQKLYDRLKIEVSDFRKKAVAQCSSLVELINQLPGEIPFNIERAKTVLSMDFGDPEALLEKAVNDRLEKERQVDEKIAEPVEAEAKPENITVKIEEEPKEAEIILTAKTEEPKAEVAFDDGAVQVAAPVAEPEVKDNVQLTFADEEEEEAPVKFFGTAEENPAPTKGHISFGVDEEDDDDDDDEPRLFFKKKKK